MKLITLANLFIKKYAEQNIDLHDFASDMVGILTDLLNFDMSLEEVNKWININKDIINKFNLTNSIYNDGSEFRFTSEDNEVYFISINSNSDLFLILSESLDYLKDHGSYFNFNVKESLIFNKYNQIPNIYGTLAVVSKKQKILQDKTYKTLIHYLWIIEPLHFLFDLTVDTDYEEIYNFIVSNYDKISKLKNLFKTNPIKLGHGADGVAYEISDRLVIKFFKDPFIYKKVREAQDRLYSNPELAKTEAMIYDVSSLGKINNHNLFYYIIEKVKPVKKTNELFYNSIRVVNNKIKEFCLSKFSNIFKDLEDNNKKISKDGLILLVNRVLNGLKQDKEFKTNIEIINNSGLLADNWLSLYIEEILLKLMTGRTDLHSGNLGISKNKQLRFFDPAHDPSQKYLNKELSSE